MIDRKVQTIINCKNKGKIPYYEIDGRPIFSRKQLIQIALKNQLLEILKKSNQDQSNKILSELKSFQENTVNHLEEIKKKKGFSL